MIIAVLGSGNGACATAADCALSGHEVRLFDFSKYESALSRIMEQGGIQATGVVEGFAKISYTGTDIEAAIQDADMIIAVGPACSNEPFAQAVKNVIQSNQLYVICPGSNGGALVTKRIFSACENAVDVVIAETATLPYAARLVAPGVVNIYHKLVGGLYLAAVPQSKTMEAIQSYRQIYPCALPGENLFRTMLQNANPVLHPVVTVMNAALIERTKGDFCFYEEGVTPAIGRLIQAIDKERIQIGNALGVEIISDPLIGVLQGYMKEADYESGYTNAPGFRGIRAQESLKHRYLDEDVGYGLVFMAELGKAVGVDTPMMDSVILLASALTETDYRENPQRTLQTMGYTIDEIRNL